MRGSPHIKNGRDRCQRSRLTSEWPARRNRGKYAAAAITRRADDGTFVVVPYTPSGLPGRRAPTPPGLAPAVTPQQRNPDLGGNAAAQDGADSRLWGGIHWRFDNERGLTMGRELASYTLASRQFGVIPEPQSWALLIAGFGLVGSALRRRRMAGPATGRTGRINAARQNPAAAG